MFNKLDELDKLLFAESEKKCNTCKGYDTCQQDINGIRAIIKLDTLTNRYKLSNAPCDKKWGISNTTRIKLDKYKIVECDNKQVLFKQLKEHNTLYIHSEPGFGKTHFLYHTANLYNEKGMSVYIDLFQNIINDIKDSMGQYKDKSITKQSLIIRLQNVDVLCLDDCGNERATAFTLLEVLQSIIDYRYLNNKITIISSNHSTTKLFGIYKNVVGVHATQIAPIISRLKDFGEIEYKSKYWRKV